MSATAWSTMAGAVVGLVLVWLLLIVAVWRVRPDELTLKESLHLLPDLLRLIEHIAADPAIPGGARIRLWLLLVYLAFPLDLIPDFIPVIGYADDAIIVMWALRSVVHRAGSKAVEQHWPGTPNGLTAVLHLAGIETAAPGDARTSDAPE